MVKQVVICPVITTSRGGQKGGSPREIGGEGIRAGGMTGKGGRWEF